MSADLIYQMVETALSLAQSELDGTDIERTLIDIVQKGLWAYEEYKGEPLDANVLTHLNLL